MIRALTDAEIRAIQRKAEKCPSCMEALDVCDQLMEARRWLRWLLAEPKGSAAIKALRIAAAHFCNLLDE